MIKKITLWFSIYCQLSCHFITKFWFLKIGGKLIEIFSVSDSIDFLLNLAIEIFERDTRKKTNWVRRYVWKMKTVWSIFWGFLCFFMLRYATPPHNINVTNEKAFTFQVLYFNFHPSLLNFIKYFGRYGAFHYFWDFLSYLFDSKLCGKINFWDFLCLFFFMFYVKIPSFLVVGGIYFV